VRSCVVSRQNRILEQWGQGVSIHNKDRNTGKHYGLVWDTEADVRAATQDGMM
jgi:hypothetical protein